MKQSKITKQILYIIFVLIWMITVFRFSGENGQKSGGTSKKVSTVIVRIITINKDITEQEKEEIVDKIDPAIRKLAHYTLYSIGGFLIINYIDEINLDKRKKVIYAIIIGALYATTDEIHQYFISDRAAKLMDVGIDTLGIITGTTIYIVIKKTLSKIAKLIKKVE